MVENDDMNTNMNMNINSDTDKMKQTRILSLSFFGWPYILGHTAQRQRQ